ncbi:hypothetical protein P43SY_003967 [Pythium insidiosum]|uniref:AB hydrolase-1 domain-containing protein n=1 Tax=Pythium insidiosum TaxID=114742 RepID=A0AAD5LG98_PYTIN|nr:hypothetical protein P43SY_003967 [Pythium insidiosum]
MPKTMEAVSTRLSSNSMEVTQASVTGTYQDDEHHHEGLEESEEEDTLGSDIASSIADSVLCASRYPDAVASSTSLALLKLFCSELEASDVHLQASDVLSLLQDTPVPEHQVLFYVTHCVPPLLMGLSSTSFTAHPSLDPVWWPRNQDKELQFDALAEPATIGVDKDSLADTCGQLAVFLLKATHCRSAERFLMGEAQHLAHGLRYDVTSTVTSVSDAFVRAQGVVRESIELFLNAQGTTFDALVDDIVSRVLAAAKPTSPPSHQSPYRRLGPQVRQILRNTSLLGLDQFSKLLQHAAHQADSAVRSGTEASLWNGRWICRRLQWSHQQRRSPSSSPRQTEISRRRSWPMPSVRHRLDDATLEDEEAARPALSLVSLLGVIICLFGVDIELMRLEVEGEGDDDIDDDEPEPAIRIHPFVFAAGSAPALPLDNVFRDAGELLPPLAAVFMELDGIYCRGRLVSEPISETRAPSPSLQIEWFSPRKAWRCLLILEPGTNEQQAAQLARRAPRRSMVVNVRLDQGSRELHDWNQEVEAEEGDGAMRDTAQAFYDKWPLVFSPAGSKIRDPKMKLVPTSLLVASTLLSLAAASTASHWEPCPFSVQPSDVPPDAKPFECTTQKVPLCYDGVCESEKKIDFFITRRPAMNESADGVQRAVILIQGGPGEPSTGMEIPMFQLQQELGGAVDFYTFDHRGTGRSEYIECEGMRSNTEDGSDLSLNEVAACLDEINTKYDGQAAGFSVTSAARDVEHLIKTYLSEHHVFLYGYSYGTYLTQRLLQLEIPQVKGYIFDDSSIC